MAAPMPMAMPMAAPNTPWVEKYRPTEFKHIVLNALNEKIIQNMLADNYIPNLLFYGPPGTGKTTTIINLIKAYQIKNHQQNRGFMIQLNASDERGIDTIRNQIFQFAQTNALLTKGMKFVILDEVDYMTKNAQQALKLIVQQFKTSVRFCLICNYVGRIDDSLQSEFMRLGFNQLPEKAIVDFLQVINITENLLLTDEHLRAIQTLYGSDMRSMINYMQGHQSFLSQQFIVNDQVWGRLTEVLKSGQGGALDLLQQISRDFQLEDTQIITDYLNYVIARQPALLSAVFFDSVEFLLHAPGVHVAYLKNYMVLRLQELWAKKIE